MKRQTAREQESSGSEFSWGGFLHAAFLPVPAQISAGRALTEVSETG